jgi:hemerythrin-like domain-containing protein
MARTRAGERTAHSSARLFADFIAEHEARHFALEESLLLPALPAGERGRLLAERVRADHRCLRDVAERLRRGHLEPSVDRVRSIGACLRAHVQMEERELFPYLERSLDVATLDRIGAQLETAD